ncbi:hypothetical protein LB503_009549 [Fusarium chuoi]|nr:hypothetical protein LB503_009549 [Fusarium chuoi]
MSISGANNNIFFSFTRRPDEESYAVQVKAEVVEVVPKECLKWIIKLHQNPYCSDFLHDTLDIISKEMIVVIAQGRTRSSSRQILHAFQKLSSKCIRKQGYVIGRPWTAEKSQTAKSVLRKSNVAVDAIPRKYPASHRRSLARVGHPPSTYQ